MTVLAGSDLVKRQEPQFSESQARSRGMIPRRPVVFALAAMFDKATYRAADSHKPKRNSALGSHILSDTATVDGSQDNSDSAYDLAINRFISPKPMLGPVQNPTSPGLIVCVSLVPLPLGRYSMWLQGKPVTLPYIPSFRTNVIDVGSEPSCWIGTPFDYVHYHVPEAAFSDVAEDFQVGSVAGWRFSLNQEDLVVAQLTRSILPWTGDGGWPCTLVRDQFSVLLAAHVLQTYAALRKTATPARGGLSPAQKRRAAEMLRANLDGQVRLSDLAQECGLSVSHFARSFKTSFGLSAHQWLIQRRVENARDLLSESELSLERIAKRSGFANQAAFTRTFQKITGEAPGRWRRRQRAGF